MCGGCFRTFLARARVGVAAYRASPAARLNEWLALFRLRRAAMSASTLPRPTGDDATCPPVAAAMPVSEQPARFIPSASSM
ncbi:hypothetical protein EON67_10680 [archaeon]|nr:MAG: hypothetical protein EON67_10680 [archaeon]